jgi:very-short-patch-repair endonuclease
MRDRASREMVHAARRLRRSATLSERALWLVLRGRGFHGLKFRRQVPIGPFVLDFFSDDLHVALEVDGPVHHDEEQRLRDIARSHALREEGIEVIRLEATAVLRDPRAAIETALASRLTNPPPWPAGRSAPPSPPAGEKGRG